MGFKWTKYSENMYLGKKSFLWSKLNAMRVNLIKKIIFSFVRQGLVLEIGSYDLYSSSTILKKNSRRFKEIHLLDLYNDASVFKIAKHNLSILKNKYSNLKFKLLKGNAEQLDLKDKYDFVFAFETLEHINDEASAIKNISNLINNSGRIIISFPVEFGFMFLIKEMGRKIILGDKRHSFKDVLFGLIGKTSKIKRIPGAHKGYDFRNTISLFEKENFFTERIKYYPFDNKFLAYGGVVVLKSKK